MNEMVVTRPLALVTGASRRIGIGSAIARRLARDGWDVAITFWRPYDKAMPWSEEPSDEEWLIEQIEAAGARTKAIEANLSLVESPARVFDTVEGALGPVTALVLSHCHGESSTIFTTTEESFDKHFAINARASWLLVREFGRRFRAAPGTGRIVALTSDHVAGNLPYGASKGALDRIVLAAAEEFRELGVTANVINPGPTDTGWMTEEQKKEFSRRCPLGRTGKPDDCANLVSFLCSPAGGWINGQLLHSDGGFE